MVPPGCRRTAPVRDVALLSCPASDHADDDDDGWRPLCVGRGLLVCHDYAAGNYHEDAHTDTAWSPKQTPYAFSRWAHCDTFVYFSHATVCPPPSGWVRAAHANGACILGTIITEWDWGAQQTRALFGTPQAARQHACSLARMAREQRFDGWFVNLEADVPPELLECVCVFLDELRARACRVVMYDSVLRDTGQVKWQNRITPHNRGWLHHVDAFFLNYGWTPETLEPQLQPQPLPCVVYAGIDVHGRGTWAGGGLDSALAVRAAASLGYSAALFAPGWTHEGGSGMPPLVADDAMWRGSRWELLDSVALDEDGYVRVVGTDVDTLLPPRRTFVCPLPCWVGRCPLGDSGVPLHRAVVAAPRFTWMCTGAGDEFFCDGVCWRPERWTNMALQSTLPATHWSAAGFSELSHARAYAFGSALRMAGRVPLYALHDARWVEAVLWGDPVHWEGATASAAADVAACGGGWRRERFFAPAGVLHAVSAGETWIGFMAFEPLVGIARVRCHVAADGTVSWPAVDEAAVAALDVWRGTSRVARVLPWCTSCTGGFEAAEEEEEDFYVTGVVE